MPNPERHGGKKDGGGGGSSQHTPGSGSSNSKERHRLASRHKRHKSRHSKESPLAAQETAAPLGAMIKPLVEYDDISSDSDTFSDDVALKLDRRENEERKADRSERIQKHRHHQHKRIRELMKSKQAEKERKLEKSLEASSRSGSTKERISGSSKRLLESEEHPKSLSSKSSNKESRSAKAHKEKSRKDRELKSSHKERSKSHRKRDAPKSYKTIDSPKRKSRSPHRKWSDSPKLDDSPSGASYIQEYDLSPPRSHTSSNYDPYRKSPGGSSRRQSISPPYKEPVAYQSNTRSPSPYSRRQRSISPYNRRRSSSYERGSGSYSGRSPSPYSRRRSSSPFATKRSVSRSPIARCVLSTLPWGMGKCLGGLGWLWAQEGLSPFLISMGVTGCLIGLQSDLWGIALVGLVATPFEMVFTLSKTPPWLAGRSVHVGSQQRGLELNELLGLNYTHLWRWPLQKGPGSWGGLCSEGRRSPSAPDVASTVLPWQEVQPERMFSPFSGSLCVFTA